MDLAAELDAVLATLLAAGVPYALAGGLAVAVWGAPRATRDIDLLILEADIPRATSALEAAGFPFVSPRVVFRDGMELVRVSRIRNKVVMKVDLMVVGAPLMAAWNSRREVETNRGPTWVISRDALMDLKRTAGRPQDLYDIQRLMDLDR